MNINYDNVNHAINKHISSWMIAIVTGLIPVLLYAGGSWVDERIDAKMGNYATKQEITTIQKQITTNQIDYFQEKVYEIQDRRIDGLTSHSDDKKMIRLNNKIKSLKEEKSNF